MIKLVTFTPPSTLEVDLENPFTTCALLRQLVEAKRKQGLTYTMIANQAGLGTATVVRIADGITKEPRMGTTIQLLRVCGYGLIARRSNR